MAALTYVPFSLKTLIVNICLPQPSFGLVANLLYAINMYFVLTGGYLNLRLASHASRLS